MAKLAFSALQEHCPPKKCFIKGKSNIPNLRLKDVAITVLAVKLPSLMRIKIAWC